MQNTCTLVMIAKNEEPYLLEWIAYHRLLGFDEIVIYENNSSDGSAHLLKCLDREGKVTHRRWTLGRNESPQITAYQDAIRKIKTEWVLFIDADEFLVLHQDDTVGDFLNRFGDRQDVTAIGVNWRIFGSSGLTGNDGRPVMERFTLASVPDFVVNRHLKSFSRVEALSGMVHMHACATSGTMVHPSGRDLGMSSWGLSDEIELTVAQVNHYYTKTAEEYQQKKARGQGGAGENKPELKFWYNDESFVGHDRNDESDTSILSKYDAVKDEIRQLEAIVRACAQ